MKIIRKKDLEKIKIQHNKPLFWIIILLLIALIVLIVVITRNSQQVDIIEGDLCLNDDDCVPATCCHPDSCVIKEKAPDCDGIICTQSCEGPIDCGAGYCGCIENQCQVISE